MSEATKTSSPLAPALVALGLCLWSAANLRDIWAADVFSRGSGWLFLLWLAPLTLVIVRDAQLRQWRPDFLMLIMSLVATVIGIVGSLNIARHVALGLALGGQSSPIPIKWVWLAGMLTWLPATGWLAKDIPGNGWPLRCVILAVSVGASCSWWKGARP